MQEAWRFLGVEPERRWLSPHAPLSYAPNRATAQDARAESLGVSIQHIGIIELRELNSFKS